MDWIEDVIKDAKEPLYKCQPKRSRQKQSLAEKIKEKGPGILIDITPKDHLQKIEKSVLKTLEKTIDKDFDVEVEALFNDL